MRAYLNHFISLQLFACKIWIERLQSAFPLPAPRALAIRTQTNSPMLKGHDMTLNAPETHIVTTNRIACDGGAGGHPRVWLQIPADKGFVECGYCDCKFILEGFEGKV